jgi:hypothetical protein
MGKCVKEGQGEKAGIGVFLGKRKRRRRRREELGALDMTHK